MNNKNAFKAEEYRKEQQEAETEDDNAAAAPLPAPAAEYAGSGTAYEDADDEFGMAAAVEEAPSPASGRSRGDTFESLEAKLARWGQ